MIAPVPILWHLVNTRRGLGTAGECAIADALTANGYTIGARHARKRGDLTVYNADGDEFYVEVKTARFSRSKTRQGFNFSLYRKVKSRVCTDHRRTDYTVLVCVYKSGATQVFVIPTGKISAISQITIPERNRVYQGKYAHYRQQLSELRLS